MSKPNQTKEIRMKASTLTIVSMAIAIAVNLVGCARDTFKQVDKPIVINGVEYTALKTSTRDPWGQDATTLTLIQSDVEQPPQMVYVQQPPKKSQAQPPQRVEAPARVHVSVVNNNNQGSSGWAKGAFQGAIGGGLQGAGIAAAGALIRPSKTTVNASGGSACSSSSAEACASASIP